MKSAAVVCFFLLVFPVEGFSAPKSQYWSLWDRSNEKNNQSIDHGGWQNLLDSYLHRDPGSGLNLFRYARVSESDKKKLSQYIGQLASLDPRVYQKAEQMPYWINLYNALTVNLVLKHYPVKSITKIGPWLSFGPWDEVIVTVAGEKLTLNDIEHRILRPLWKDNRIHYAVNCASKGCPDLSSVVFTASNTNSLLDQLAQRFVNHPKGVQFKDGKLILSKIFRWYQDDFGDKQKLLLHLSKYADKALAEKLSGYTGSIRYDYDWSLNESQ